MNEHLAISSPVLYSSGVSDKLSSKMWMESNKLLIRYNKFVGESFFFHVRLFQQGPFCSVIFLEGKMNQNMWQWANEQEKTEQ